MGEVLDADPSWAPKRYGDEEGAMRDAEVADAMVDDCSRTDQDTDHADSHGLTDLNGIALRLCVSGHASVQDAVKDAAKACHVRKVAVVGFRVLDHGQVQTTLASEGDGAARHHYVPRHMSIAPNENNGRDLSKLYQLIGRGFVVMDREAPLPTDWRLDLLATNGTRKLCRLYGNAELLLGQIRKESIEGRKLALGTALTSITRDNGELEYGPILDQPLRGGKTNARNGENPLMLKTVLAANDAQHHTPFRVVRDCLGGVDAPKRQLAQRKDNRGTLKGVLLEPEFRRTPDILDDELHLRIKCTDPREKRPAVDNLAEQLAATVNLNSYEDGNAYGADADGADADGADADGADADGADADGADADGDGADGDGADGAENVGNPGAPGPSSGSGQRGPSYLDAAQVENLIQLGVEGGSPASSSP